MSVGELVLDAKALGLVSVETDLQPGSPSFPGYATGRPRPTSRSQRQGVSSNPGPIHAIANLPQVEAR